MFEALLLTISTQVPSVVMGLVLYTILVLTPLAALIAVNLKRSASKEK